MSSIQKLDFNILFTKLSLPLNEYSFLSISIDGSDLSINSTSLSSISPCCALQ